MWQHLRGIASPETGKAFHVFALGSPHLGWVGCLFVTMPQMAHIFVVIETLTFILGDFLKNREASQNRSPEATALVQSPNMSMPNNKPMQETHYII